MAYYIIASKVKVMKTNLFSSPFPSGLEQVTNEKIAKVIEETAQANESFILFTELEKAKEFARKVAYDTNDTVAAYYIEYPPVIEITVKDENAIVNDKDVSLAVKGFFPMSISAKSVKLSNIDKVCGYYYQQGSYAKQLGTFVTLDQPLSLLEMSSLSHTNSCLIS